MDIALLRLPALSARLGIGRASIYSHIATGLLMPPVKLGLRTVAWPSDEVSEYIAAKVRGASNEELRALVGHLVAARTQTGRASA